jgi:secreted PhoX family phosphatase
MKLFFSFALTIVFCNLFAQKIADFSGVEPLPQSKVLTIPDSHAFQFLIRADDVLKDGTKKGRASDYTAYFPKNGSSREGTVFINTEFIPGGVTYLDLKFNTTSGLWQIDSSGNVDFSAFNCALAANSGTIINCSGGMTPWGTIITSEEAVDPSICMFGDYNTFGWNVEIDGVTKKIMDYDNDGVPDKVWAMGRMKHENACFLNDSLTSYYGDDNGSTGFVFKFVADRKADLSSGKLYALKLNDNDFSVGEWLLIPNTTAVERNTTINLTLAAGATKFDRVEDVEIGPDGKVYVVSTGQDKIFRFKDDGATVSSFEIYVDEGNYDIPYGDGQVKNVFFSSPDNIVFDCDGYLWINQDGGDNHLWVVSPDHTMANPKIRVFANSPRGCETTGLTFTPDCRYGFFSVQHPEGSNNEQQVDAAGESRTYSRDITVVFGRKEFFGPGQETSVTEKTIAFNDIKLFPNPAVDRLTIEFYSQQFGEIDLSVYDIAGKKLTAQKLFANYGINEYEIDVKMLPAGKYIVKFNSKYGTGQKGFVK